MVSTIMYVFAFLVYSQSLSLMPKDTQLVDKKEQKQGEIVIKTYRFHSQSTKEEINEFYQQMFSNEGFKEAKQAGASRHSLVLLKVNSIASLNFVPDYEDKTATYYYLQIQELPADVKLEDNSLQTGKSPKPVDKEIKRDSQPQ